jgi:hypothetical protein
LDEPYADDNRSARGGGRDFTFDRRLCYVADFAADQGEMYARNVRAAVEDIAAAWRDPNHRLRADAQAGLASLRVAAAVRPGQDA